MSIFKDFAPLYWGAGLPVVPLKRWNSPGKGAGKAPLINEWTAYSENMPTPSIQTMWLSSYPDSNVGLPFGPASGLCAIDIDTDDEELIAAIKEACGPSPWTRVGKKGMGLIYRWQGQPNFKLRNNENQSIVEFLGKGNQMVMPPSIHPDTGKPYVANANLWEILDTVPLMPVDIEARLRAALEPVLGTRGFSLAQTGRSAPLAVVPQGERDIQLVRHAGYLARVVRGIDKRERFTLMEAMAHMHTWVEDFTSSVTGDDMDPEKGVAKLLEFLVKDVEGGATLPNGWDTGLTADLLADPRIDVLVKGNEVQRWTVGKAKNWLEEQVAARPEDTDWGMQKVTELVELLARDENFSLFEFKSMFDNFRRAVDGVKLSKPDLTRAFQDARRGDEGSAEDHEAIAREVLDALSRGGEIRHDLGQFWQWSGSCFEPMDDNEIYRFISGNVKGNVLARRHNDYAALVKAVAILAEKPLETSNEIGVNFANGFLDSDGVLHDHDPKYGKTFTLPFDYVPERADEAHRWLAFLEQSWGDDEDYADKVLALQEAMAATMFGLGPVYQRAVLLHGKAGSGKTQLLEIMQALMPPSSQCAVPPTAWNENFALVGMVGKTLNVAGELPEESVINGAKFKSVVVGEILSDSFKGKDKFNFRPIATHWFGSNFLPRTRDTSEGFVRRWLILDFNRAVPAEERIADFWKVLIAEEREAIAAWAVKGLKRLQSKGDYTQPASHVGRLQQILRANNSVAAFLTWTDAVEKGERGADARVVFDKYMFYMREISRGWSVTYERFVQMMGELGYEPEDYRDPLGNPRQRFKGLQIKGPEMALV